jgi:HlyD family secretion protein
MQVDEQADKQVETSTEVSNISGDTQSTSAKNQTINMKKALAPKSSNKLLIPAIALAIAALGVSIWFVIGRFSSNPSSATSPATNTTGNSSKEQPRAISALGRVEPQGEVVKVASPSALGTSRIVKLMVKEGDMVKQGQVIAILDSYDRSVATLLQAQSQAQESDRNLARVRAGAKGGDIEAQAGNVEAAKANVNAISVNAARLKAELDIAERDYNRFQQLQKDGAISESMLDTYRLKAVTLAGQLEQTKQQIQQAEFSLKQSQGLLSSVREVRPTDIQFAEAQLQTAMVNVKKAEVDLDLAQVRAPIDGQVLKINTKTGEFVSQTNGVVDLGNTSQMYVVAEIYETDIGKIKVGQKASIQSEAFEGEITGKVDRIGLRIAKNDVLGTDPAAKTDVRIIELEREWNAAYREKKCLSLILFDIDYFKKYNDTYGHLAGDDCLCQVAIAASGAIKRPRDTLARYGGEEFAVILPDTDASGAEFCANQIRFAIENLHISHSSSQINSYVTASLGLTTISPHTQISTSQQLIKEADLALYQAKHEGRNRVKVWTTNG